jgi:hypothetical protein
MDDTSEARRLSEARDALRAAAIIVGACGALASLWSLLYVVGDSRPELAVLLAVLVSPTAYALPPLIVDGWYRDKLALAEHRAPRLTAGAPTTPVAMAAASDDGTGA